MTDTLIPGTGWAAHLDQIFDRVDRTVDAEAPFSDAEWAKVRESGILAAPFPEAEGGDGLSLVETLHRLEGFGRANPNAGLSFSTVTSMASTGVALARAGSPALRREYLPKVCSGSVVGSHAITEYESGSDALHMATTATRDGDHFVLSGRKAFVTNASVADVYVVYARTSATASPLGLTAFLVPKDTPGLTVVRTMETMGLRGSPIGELHLSGCRVPAAQVVGRVGGGFLLLDHVMEREVMFSFMVNVGEMQARLERTVEWARSRQQYGKPIAEYQAISHKIVDMHIAVETARMWLIRAAETADRGESATLPTSIAKLLTSRANTSTALDAMQVFGGRGYVTEFGMERELRNAVAGSVYSGTNEIQYNRIAAMAGLR